MAFKTNKAIKISQKHLLGIQDLSVNDINYILDESEAFIKLNQSKNKKIDVLRGKTQINLFFEPSTRTAIANDTAVTFGNTAKGIFRMDADVYGWEANAVSTYGFTFSCTQAF